MYRIVKRGTSNTYLVQQKVFWFFWTTRMGEVISLNSAKEAREYVEIFINEDKHRESLKDKDTIVGYYK